MGFTLVGECHASAKHGLEVVAAVKQVGVFVDEPQVQAHGASPCAVFGGDHVQVHGGFCTNTQEAPGFVAAACVLVVVVKREADGEGEAHFHAHGFAVDEWSANGTADFEVDVFAAAGVANFESQGGVGINGPFFEIGRVVVFGGEGDFFDVAKVTRWGVVAGEGGAEGELVQLVADGGVKVSFVPAAGAGGAAACVVGVERVPCAEGEVETGVAQVGADRGAGLEDDAVVGLLVATEHVDRNDVGGGFKREVAGVGDAWGVVGDGGRGSLCLKGQGNCGGGDEAKGVAGIMHGVCPYRFLREPRCGGRD